MTVTVVERSWKEGVNTFATLNSVRVAGSEPDGIMRMVKLLTASTRYEEKHGMICESIRDWIRRVRCCRIIEGTVGLRLEGDFSLPGRVCEAEVAQEAFELSDSS